MHLTKVERGQVEAVAEVLKPWGLAWALERTHHLIMVLKDRRGGKWRLLLACTPRNAGDAVDIARQKAKRLVREINARVL